jgi:hypothetical protein
MPVVIVNVDDGTVAPSVADHELHDWGLTERSRARLFMVVVIR